MTASTKTVLNALRAVGLTAKSGFGANKTPALECANITYLNGRVLNLNAFSKLGFGCYGHADYDVTHAAMAALVEEALTAAGVSFERRRPDQYFINGYKGSR